MAKKKKEKKVGSAGLRSAIAQLDRRFGTGTVRKMSDAHVEVNTFSSGRPQLDQKLGGGYAVGKIVEIYAESATGKTGLALEAIASIQKEDGVVAFIDAENALNLEYAEEIGVQVDDMYIVQPDDGEQAFEVIRGLIGSGEVDLIVVDSVSALIPRAELDGESGEAKIALQARMMSQGMKMISGSAASNECTVLFINQLRSAIMSYGASTKTTGGKALPYYASQRLEIKNKGKLKEGDEVVGFKQLITVTKNKIGRPFAYILENIVYGKGIDHIRSLIEAAIFEGIFTKHGAWIKYEGENIAQGQAKLVALMEDNEEFVETIKAKVEEASQ